jgi:hypothetical protein
LIQIKGSTPLRTPAWLDIANKTRCPDWVIRVVSAMSVVGPLCPHEPTSSVRPTRSEKSHNRKCPTHLISSARSGRNGDTGCQGPLQF